MKAAWVLRSAVYLAWVVVTVVPWALAVMVASLFLPGRSLYWMCVGWVRLAVGGARVLEVVHVIDPFQRGGGVQHAEEIDITKTNAALAGKVCPIVAGGVKIERNHLFWGELVRQNDVRGAPLGHKPVAL